MAEHKYMLVTLGKGPKKRTDPVESIDEAKEIAREVGSNGFFLIPKAQGTNWRGYILEGGEWKEGLAQVFQNICPNTLKVVGGRGEAE